MRILLAVLISAGSAFGAASFLCEEDYYLQRVEETIRTGSAPEAGTVESWKILGPSLQGIRILSDSTQYRMLSGFGGGCSSPEKKNTTYWIKPKGSQSFTTQFDSQFVQMFTNPLVGTRFTLWFGLGPDTANGQVQLVTAVGSQTPGPPFHFWYAATVLLDSSQSSTTGLWQVTTRYYQSLFAYPDSSRLDSLVLDQWRQIPFNGNDRRGRVQVQFLKVIYDTIPTAAIHALPVRGIRPTTLGFGAAPMTFDLMGRAVRENHRAGGLYLHWQGDRAKRMILEERTDR